MIIVWVLLGWAVASVIFLAGFAVGHRFAHTDVDFPPLLDR